MIQLFHDTCFACSRLVTQAYSTSFTLGIKTLHKRFHNPIYAIYGFVRFADEIVDTFHDFDKKELLARFNDDAYQAIEEGISLNPILHSFAKVVKQYSIDGQLIDAFIKSMEMDIYNNEYHDGNYNEYIYGSAEVVGLMCLKVFCEGNDDLYRRLESPARSLGAAFQKVNFLRDIKSDFFDRGRIYFPGINFTRFTVREKQQIEKDIQKDFDDAYKGIKQLPKGARGGVYLAYVYYLNLFEKIKNTNASRIVEERIRISDRRKLYMLATNYFRYRFNLL